MQTHETSGWTETGRRTRAERALAWAVGGAVLACFFALAVQGYFIRAYSDCYNWLGFARNFGQEFTRSRWPYGFALFLRGALAVVGPYYVFLANLPVMVALFAVTAWIGTGMRRDDAAGRGGAALPPGWAFLAVWIPVLAADAGSFTRYLNPYRDPLSYVLVMLSAALFVRSLAKGRPGGAAASGAVLGLASSVREPSILMVVPFVAYGLWTWAGAKDRIPPVKTAAAFALGFLAAMVPFLVQTYLTTHQLLLPPQASLEAQVVPGVRFTAATFARTGRFAWTHYVRHEPWLLLLAAAGTAAAVRRRNRLVLALALPAAAAYAAFYTFYWTFVVRYYYVAVLFLALAAGYGVQSFLAWLCGRWPRRGRLAGWLLLAAAACAAGGRLLACRPDGPVHQVPQAKAFAEALAGTCPDAAVVYADRFLCEWIDWFMPYASQPLPASGSAGGERSAGLRNGLGPRLERGETLYSAVCGGAAGTEVPDVPFLRRAFDRIPAASLDAEPFRAGDYARGTVWFHRIRPWSGHRTELAWPAPCGERYWYMLDTGDPLEGEPRAIAVTVDGVRQPATLVHGGAQVGEGLPRECGEGEPGTAVAESDGRLPREMAVAAGRLDDPIPLDFRMYGPFDHFRRLRGDVRPGRDWHWGAWILSRAEIAVPVPWPDRGGVLLECDLLSSHKTPGQVLEVGAYEGPRRLAGVRVPADRLLAKLLVPLPDDPERAVRTVRLEIENGALPEGTEPDIDRPCIELYQVLVHRRPAAYPVEIRLDGRTDSIHALSGFHPAEGRGSGAYRWTEGAAEVAVYAPEGSGGRDVGLRIVYSTAAVPAEVNGDGRIRVLWDGAEIAGRTDRTDGGAASFAWSGTLPADRVGTEAPHRLRVEVPAWRPADYGSGDRRTLGVQLRRIGLEEAGAAGRAP